VNGFTVSYSLVSGPANVNERVCHSLNSPEIRTVGALLHEVAVITRDIRIIDKDF